MVSFDPLHCFIGVIADDGVGKIEQFVRVALSRNLHVISSNSNCICT